MEVKLILDFRFRILDFQPTHPHIPFTP